MLREQSPLERNQNTMQIPKLTKPDPRAHVSEFDKIHINGFLISPRVHTYQKYQNPITIGSSNPQV